MDIVIRNEIEADHRKVEEITREAFWNLYAPGCNEHYLAHIMRNHEDYIRDLELVAVVDGKIAGNIMYTKSYVINEQNTRKETLTFGPVSVLPDYQGKGIGSALIKYSIRKAIEANAEAIIIYGHPRNYCKHGFKSSKDFNISTTEGKYPYALLVLELGKDVFTGHTWKYKESDIFGSVNEKEAEEYDKQFVEKKKEYRYTQEEFSIACRAFIE